MENIKLEKVMVELEDTDDGRKKLKRLKNGLHPIEVLAEILAEENDIYKKKHGVDRIKWGSYFEPGEPNEMAHEIYVLYEKNEIDEWKPTRRFVLWDKAIDKPVPKRLNVPGKPGMKTMDRHDTLEHVGNYLDFTKMRAKAEERGLHLQATTSWDIFEKAKRRLEG